MAKKKAPGTPERLQKIEDRLGNLEALIRGEVRAENREIDVEPWKFLVRRRHPWRKQLYVKGRNLTARQLVGSIRANQLNDEKAAENYHLPLVAIHQALAYVEMNAKLLQAEAEIERLMLERGGEARVPQPVS